MMVPPNAPARAWQAQRARWMQAEREPHFQTIKDFPGGLLVKNPLASAGDTGLIRGSRRFYMPLDI